MTQSKSTWFWKLELAISLAASGAIVSSRDCSLAQIAGDTTLGSESSVVTPLNSQLYKINGGARREANLFHSFQVFNIREGQVVEFTNSPGINNIVSRVTGGSRSEILGRLSVLGSANLFLINPNGIIFGSNASLDVKGSFLATTANAIQFGDQGFFSASDPNAPSLLTVNPSALLFSQVAAEPTITNSSRAPAGLDPLNRSRRLFGLQVPDGQSLLLVGGNVSLNGGGLNALGGRVELGGLAEAGMVGLDFSANNLRLSFPNGLARADVSLTNQAQINASGEGGGDIQLQGRRVLLTGGSRILATTLGSQAGGSLVVTASEFFKLIGPGNPLNTRTIGAGDAGDITITTGKLIIQKGAQVSTSSNGEGSGGQLTVNASESVELAGISPGGAPNGLFSLATASGSAGNINITTRRLLVQDGGNVSTASSGSVSNSSIQSISVTGQAGDLTVNALDSIELSGTRLGPDGKPKPSVLSAETTGSRNGGNLRIATRRLTVRDGAEVSVSSGGIGDAGDIKVTANSIELDNEGKLTATSESGEGGDIRLQDLDLLLLRDDSEISTTAGSATGGTGNGGNITINTDILVGSKNSDITANAFEGKGGNIKITTQGLFLSPDSDITASSEEGIDGVVEINRPEAEPSSGLVTLPTELVDVSRLIAQGCVAGGGNVARAGKFVATGRGGLPPTPIEALRSDAVLADLGTPVQGEDRAGAASPNLTNLQPTPLVEAQGWVIGSKGEIVLTAQAPTVTSIPWLTPTSCDAS